ncbi:MULTISPECIES: NblA/ycf18 family protein [unclassified Microcoleus]|uniref:NblA/ycf18 family protein n=1 Tax=unclassified Microcoleus TaxID=2642155 RepID=UPI00403F34F8
MIVYNVGDTTNPAKRHFDRTRIDLSKLEERIMDMPTTSLSMEQQFKLQVLSEQVKSLSQDQAQEYLLEVMRQNMVKENLLKYWMKKM